METINMLSTADLKKALEFVTPSDTPVMVFTKAGALRVSNIYMVGGSLCLDAVEFPQPGDVATGTLA